MKHGWLIYDDFGAKRNEWFIARLCEAALQKGLSLELILAKDLQFGVNEGKKFLSLRGKECLLPDFVLCRTIFPLLSEFFEDLGIPTFNSALVSRVCNDKRKTHLFLADSGIPMAKTLFFENHTFNPMKLTYPVVLKSKDGHGGKQVFWADTPNEAEEFARKGLGKDFLVQEPVTKGKDVRVYLLDGEILFATLRSCDTDFRSNFSLGGKISPYTPCNRMLRAIDVVKERMSPFYVGIDFTFDSDGTPLLNEVEDVVGSRMLYELTDIPLHQRYIDRLCAALKSK